MPLALQSSTINIRIFLCKQRLIFCNVAICMRRARTSLTGAQHFVIARKWARFSGIEASFRKYGSASKYSSYLRLHSKIGMCSQVLVAPFQQNCILCFLNHLMSCRSQECRYLHRKSMPCLRSIDVTTRRFPWICLYPCCTNGKCRPFRSTLFRRQDLYRVFAWWIYTREKKIDFRTRNFFLV